jgi:hypothetical protein
VNLWQYLDRHPFLAFVALIALWGIVENIVMRWGSKQ